MKHRRGTFLMFCATALLLSAATASGAQQLIDRRTEARADHLGTGAGTYGNYCEPCHGAAGKEPGTFWNPQVTPGPANLTTLGVDKDHLEAVIRGGSVAHGKSNRCPPWQQTLTDAQIERLAQHVLAMGGGAVTSAAPATVATVAPREPFPWRVTTVIVVELVLIAYLLRRRYRLAAAS